MPRTFIIATLLFLPFSFASAQTVVGITNTILDLLIRPLINIMLILATAIFAWGIIEYVAKADNEEARTIGRRHMMWGIIGLVIMFSAVGLITILESFWAGIPVD